MSEVATINGIQYIGTTAPNESVLHHAESLDSSQTIESAVLAGPITFTSTVTVTGNVVIV
jgi:hypothetical protein|tara:strand:- start:1039 stop:1218 length:180 start_codon:yes stop_codon:yes gene_type:complete